MNSKSVPLSLPNHARWWLRWTAHPKAAGWAAFVGGLVYLVQSLYYAHFQDISMDEGTYLMKGLLYVTGVYRPFQTYGPNTNKMPLSFLIPGTVQALFEPGVRTGRYFAVLLSLLMLLGLWLVTRRMAGKTWAAGVVWIMAISPANLFIYSQAITQGTVACMLVWMLVLIVGPGRSRVNLVLGGVLAAAVVLTRQNMLPVLLFLVGYVLWQHGWRKALLSGGAAALVMLVVHILYWPGILAIWSPWLPKFVNQWLKPVYSQYYGKAGPGASGTSVWNPVAGLAAQLQVVWEGVRYNFVGTLGMLISWIFWPRRSQWKNDAAYKLTLSLSLLLALLIGAHAWAALFKDYCLYCYSGYLAFFMPAALLLVAASFASWVARPGWLRQILASGLVLVSSLGIAFSGYQALGWVLNLPVPRLRGLRLQPGTSELWRLLSNKYHLAYETLEMLLPALFGLLVGVLILLLALIIVRRLRRQGKPAVFAYVVLGLLVGLGILLSPTPLMAGSKQVTNLCKVDVIASHEQVGAQLRAVIPAGSLVYWMNNVSPLPLLYLPQVRVFPAQLNHWYTFREGGDPAYLERLGYWNQALADRWLQQADFALVEDKYVEQFSRRVAGLYDELPSTARVVYCRDRSNIHIFERIKP